MSAVPDVDVDDMAPSSQAQSQSQPVRKCTCVMETESDSESDCDLLLGGGSNSSLNSATTGAVNASAVNGSASASASGSASASAANAPSFPMRPRKFSGVRDTILTSTALHHSEALRQAQFLQNVFCACYDVDMVLALVQRRERTFSPVQATLLQTRNMAQVLAWATTPPDQVARDDPQFYRRSYIATEIVLRFYLKAIAWHGEPKSAASFASSDLAAGSPPSSSSSSSSPPPSSAMDTSKPLPLPPHAFLTARSKSTSSLVPPPFSRDSNSLLSFRELHSSSTSQVASMATPEVRGFVLRLEELSENEWKKVFMELYSFMWLGDGQGSSSSSNGSNRGGFQASADAAVDVDVPAALDDVLVANMSRITKCLVIYPAVHRMIISLEHPTAGELMMARLARHTDNLEIVTLLHGLVHLAHRRELPYLPILRHIFRRLVDMPRLANATPAAAIGVAMASPPRSPSLSFAQVFRHSLLHARVTGCVEILVKILNQQFPNTYRYSVQTRSQLASFESVEAFEKELFPLKALPHDRTLHEDLKSAVLCAVLEHSELLTRLAKLGLAELRYLDAHHHDGLDQSIPPYLVLDVVRLAIEASLNDKDRLGRLLPVVQLVTPTICAAINYQLHLTTILEFASRECFSDSDSDDSAEDCTDEQDETDDESASAPADSAATHDLPRILPIQGSPLTAASRPDASVPPIRIPSPPSSGNVNYRPVTCSLLAVHVVNLLAAIVAIAKDSIDIQLARLDAAKSLLGLFERYPKSNVLHCRIVKLLLLLLDRKTTGRVNNPLLRSLFRSPGSLLDFIMHKLCKSSASHQYDAHLAIIGVKMDKICSSPTLQQEMIRQHCGKLNGWTEFCSSLVARHYQQMDALDVSLLGLNALGGNTGLSGRRGSSSDRHFESIDDIFPLARPSSSPCEFLSTELQPFRRLPMETEGFGSSSNLATGNEAVHPTDMVRSRSQSQFPQSIIEILRLDTATSFEATEDDFIIEGFAYQKLSKWVKVRLRLEKANCELTLEEVQSPAGTSSSTKTSSGSAQSSSKSKIKQFLMGHKQQWNTRPKKLLVCNARKWIAFGRSIKNPDIGAFGFQIDVFDHIREDDQTLTFVTRSERTRTRWFDALQLAVSRSRTLRQSFCVVDEDVNIAVVRCVATRRESGSSMALLALPDVNLLGPLIAASFFLKSEVPEELPFWGTFHGIHGVTKYVSLFNSCLRAVSVQEKRVFASGYSVIIEFECTFQAITHPIEKPGPEDYLAVDQDGSMTVMCLCTDTYMISGNQIIGLTRTIADSEKLVKIVCSDE